MAFPDGFAFATDFDGTVTVSDVAALLLDEFTDDGWKQIEKGYREGKITCREALRTQFETLRGTKVEMTDFMDANARIDPCFKPFLSYCMENGIPVRIVSEGLDFYIEHLLRVNDIDVPFFTNKAHFEDGGIRISFPNASLECEDCGTCKLGILKDWRGEGKKIIYAGDGMNDICPAETCDVVFAKGDLLAHYRMKGLEHIEFEGYADIMSEVKRW
jgi:2,3-diketo-5-methylthio-1-phosphopentane phosphatase